MATQIKLRRDTAANWTSANPTLALGEPGVETDTQKVKYGDGSTDWANLSYAAGGAEIGNALSNVNSISTETGSNFSITADGGIMTLGVDGATHTTFNKNLDNKTRQTVDMVIQTDPTFGSGGNGFGNPTNVDALDAPVVDWLQQDVELGEIQNLSTGMRGSMIYPAAGGGNNVLRYVEANTNIYFGSTGTPFDGAYGGVPGDYNPANASVLVFDYVAYGSNAYVTAWSSIEL